MRGWIHTSGLAAQMAVDRRGGKNDKGEPEMEVVSR